jgi:hypothetical protein
MGPEWNGLNEPGLDRALLERKSNFFSKQIWRGAAASDLFTDAHVVDTRVFDPLERFFVTADHAAMQQLSSLGIHFTYSLHHAVAAFVADIIHFDGLYGAFDFGHLSFTPG